MLGSTRYRTSVAGSKNFSSLHSNSASGLIGDTYLEENSPLSFIDVARRAHPGLGGSYDCNISYTNEPEIQLSERRKAKEHFYGNRLVEPLLPWVPGGNVPSSPAITAYY